MGGKNAYLQAVREDRQRFFEAGCDIAAQQMYDMMCLVLHDPEIMGRDTFGPERLKKVHEAMYQRESFYHEAWIHTQESDYYQEKMDAELREIFGDELQPFAKRYPYTKDWDYRKTAAKNR